MNVDALERASADSTAKEKAKTKKAAKVAVQKPSGPAATAKPAGANTPQVGKTARVWLGVRFSTARELREADGDHKPLRVVPG